METQVKMSRRQFARISALGSSAAPLLSRAAVPRTGAKPCPGGREVIQASGNAIFRSDLSQCQPAEALSRSFESGRWQLLDYETVEGVKGVMAAAIPEEECGELTLPLDVKGPHRIYLGINYTKARYHEWSPYGQLEAKLTGDGGFFSVAAEGGTNLEDGSPKIGEGQWLYKAIQETYWRTADLTGRSLIFRQPRSPYRRSELANISNLAYVKLVPLSEHERRRWVELQPTDETRRGAVIYCTGNFTGHTRGTSTFYPTDEQWIRDDFSPYLESDIKLFIFEALRGNCCVYRTRIGDVGHQDNRWQESWVDPLAVYTRLAHAHGMKIFASLRMIGAQYPMNREPIARARNYWQNREFAKLDRDGVALTGLSLAFPEVREYWLRLLRETLAYGTDGIQLHLNRAVPFVHYEGPVIRTFRERYGTDPRELPETDVRWQKHCAAYVTEFIREVRKLLDEKPGRELGVTLFGQPHEYDLDKASYDPIRYNCDVETWLCERLVDYLMPSPYVDLRLLRKWRQLGGGRVHLWPDLMPRTQMPHQYAQLAKKYYEAGADGFCVWDGERRAQRLSEWAAVQRLGHRDQLDRLIREGPSYHRRVYLKYFAGFSVERSFHDG
ncbi:MAG: hypothetical protein HXY20_01675 [Acidobacteria bacterium]|nr:hypothetical protein [Acidobacteriota bacterium]